MNGALAGRVAVVTGAGRGIGLGLARALTDAGAHVVATGRDAAALAATGLPWSVLDVTDTGGLAGALGRIAHEHGTPDILVNNAGIEKVCPSLDVTEALWDSILDTNLKAAFFCAQAAARLMREAGRGGVVLNVCSLTSERGVPAAVAYTASKTGLVGMTRALAVEWAKLGIRVNGIGPGYVRTALTESFYADADWQTAMLARTPAGRFSVTADLAGAATFLCSDAAAFVTGQVLYVDGGILAAL